ncbi:MAG: NUDIX domain-containing protein [Gemmatimonadetes bacterium]|nr:NUDIX domain-containing protein [Gemmatimonadota bacterium]MYJ88241.1 NUDIX domain-containing protein [Gemmatimonadota bacterium]
MSVISSAMLVNSDGDILINLRDDDPRIIFPNKWSLIGGYAQEKEDPEQGLIREVKEEIGYEVTDRSLLATFFDRADVWHLYLAPINVPIDYLILGEGQAIRFIDPARALTELDLCVTSRCFIEVYLRYLDFQDYARSRKPTVSVISSAMLVNPAGDILVNLRDDDPRIIFPNQWSLIGGHVEENESPEEGLVREVEEEIGYRLSDYDLLATFFDGTDIRNLYIVPIDVPIDDLVLGEGQAIRYIDSARALNELDLCVTGRRCIEVYLRHLEFQEYVRSRTDVGSQA